VRAQTVVLRHEHVADGVVTGRRQREAELARLIRQEVVRDLDHDAGAVARKRIGANRAAVFQVVQNVQCIGDDLVRFLALQIGDEADAAGVALEGGIKQALGRRPAFTRTNLIFNRGQITFAHVSSLVR
jgi:hypothetical protein